MFIPKANAMVCVHSGCECIFDSAQDGDRCPQCQWQGVPYLKIEQVVIDGSGLILCAGKVNRDAR